MIVVHLIVSVLRFLRPDLDSLFCRFLTLTAQWYQSGHRIFDTLLKPRRYQRLGLLLSVRDPPFPRIVANAGIPAVIAIIDEFLPNSGHPTSLLLRKDLVLLKNFLKTLTPGSELRIGLRLAHVLELRRARSDYLSNRSTTYFHKPTNFPDALLLDEVVTPNHTDLFHANHPRLPFHRCRMKRSYYNQM